MEQPEVIIPQTIGGCIDALYKARAERLALSKKVDEAKAVEAMFEDHILNTFNKSDLEGAKGELATASIKRSTVYQLEDWPTFIAYVSEQKAWELLRKQPGSTACKEHFENGQPIPGIKPYQKIDLSITKA